MPHERKLQLQIQIYMVIVTEVFAQIGASIKIKESVKPETIFVEIRKMLRKYGRLKPLVKIQ